MTAKQSITSSNLFVPLYLDALVVNEKSSRYSWKNLALDFNNFSYRDSKGLGSFLEAPVDIDSSEKIYETGVHLHWTLPKGFRHGAYNRRKDALEFPAVPNRWLVVRSTVSETQETTLLHTLWIVESDRINETGEVANNWIQSDEADGSFKPVRLGTKRMFWPDKAPETHNSTAEAIPLTIMAPGNPSFASSYMHSKNTFGFYDDMAGTARHANLSYRVYGWFADGKDDPFFNIEDKDELKIILEKFAFKLPFVNDSPYYPAKVTGTVYHAVINNIGWSADKLLPSSVPSLNKISVSIGNSSSDALSVLLSDNVKKDPQVDPRNLLTAFQYKNLIDYGLQGSGLNALKQQTHGRTFSTSDGGSFWVLDRKEQGAFPTAKDSGSGISVKAFGENISRFLKELNHLQSEYDNTLNQLSSCQSRLYAASYKKKYLLTNASIKPAEKSVKDIQQDLQMVIDASIKEVDNLKHTLWQLQHVKNALRGDANTGSIPNYAGEIPDKYTELTEAISNDKHLKHFELKQVPMPKYQEPVNPTIVIDGLNPAPRYTDNQNQYTECRFEQHLAAGISITYRGQQYGAEPDYTAISGLIAAMDKAMPNAVGQIFTESLLFDVETMAAKIMDFNPRFLDDDRRAIKKILSVVTSDLKKSESKFFNQTTVTARVPESFSCVEWVQPWIPLYMEWGVQWRSTYEKLSPQMLEKEWVFGNEENPVDYSLTDQENLPEKRTTYMGRTMLSHDLTTKINQLNMEISKRYNAAPTQQKGLFRDMRPMSQELSGLHEQLIQRYAGIQLPIVSLQKDESFQLDPVNDHIGNEFSWSPMANNQNFFALRGGIFKLTTLRIVDAFGQVLNIIPADQGVLTPAIENGKLLHSAGMQLFPGQSSDSYLVLPPRVLQPARMRFDWLSEKYPGRISDSDPGTSPVCGWLLPNPLNQSISVFDPDGNEVGELLKKNGETVFNKTSGANPGLWNTLSQIIDNLIHTDGAYDEISKEMDLAQKKLAVKPSRLPLQMRLPVGSPLAIVNARCLFELKGEAVLNQYWVKDEGSTGVSDIAFKAILGDEPNPTDGLIGYFTDHDYTAMNLPAGMNKSLARAGSYLTHGNGISCVKDQAVMLTLLLDPRGSVKIRSGILPAFSVEIPHVFIDDALKRIELSFLVAPVISPVSGIKMPLLDNSGTAWQWIQKSGIAGEQPIIQKPESDIKNYLGFEPIHAVEGWLKLKNTTE